MIIKKLRYRIAAASVAAAMLFSLTGCEGYAEWEARTAAETAARQEAQANQESTESSYQGPSLADYVNSGIEEAKENGLYHETDYSSILSGSSSSSSSSSGSSDSDSNTSGSGSGSSSGSATAVADARAQMLVELASVEYDGEAYIEVNDNIPYFTEDDYTLEAFEFYSDLDDLGRVGMAYACIDQSIMPDDDEERGDISSVKPTGWVQRKYDGISNGGWIYNRCHLIAWSLAGENANEKNLMTGTRYFNIDGMFTFEAQALEYLGENPDNHLLYRVEPVFDGDDLLAKGLLMEAYSIEDGGGLEWCVYVFNVQPGISIDYTTGSNQEVSE